MDPMGIKTGTPRKPQTAGTWKWTLLKGKSSSHFFGEAHQMCIELSPDSTAPQKEKTLIKGFYNHHELG